MFVLLDESMPEPVAKMFPDWADVSTVGKLGWKGTKNGELMRLAAKHNFDVLITSDKRIEDEAIGGELMIPVLILDSVKNELSEIIPILPIVFETIETGLPPGFHLISNNISI